MAKERVVETDEKPIYFTMKMSEEFINLGVDDKKRLAKKMIKETVNPRKLSKDDLKQLMVTAKNKTGMVPQ